MKRLTELKNGILNFDIFETVLGWSAIILTDKGVLKYFLPFEKKESLMSSVNEEWGLSKTEHRNPRTQRLIENIKGYFRGDVRKIIYPLDFAFLTPFQKEVYKTTHRIPYGTVRTYQWVSSQMGYSSAQRAVGGALSQNPFPLFVPCHRVIRSDGEIGGFSAGEGVLLKKRMLEIEG